MVQVLRFAVVCLLAVCAQAKLTAREVEFLQCVVALFDIDWEDYCYFQCYLTSFEESDRNPNAYIKAASEVALDLGTLGYDMFDWMYALKGETAGNKITQEMVLLEPEKKENEAVLNRWITSVNAPFIAMTAQPPLEGPEGEKIRATMRVKEINDNGDRVLWQVVRRVMTDLRPSFIKVCTPKYPRDDTMLFAWSERDLKGKFTSFAELFAALSAIAEEFKADLASGSELPPFQYQGKENGYVSVADYAGGASFGRTLCKTLVHPTQKYPDKRQTLVEALKLGEKADTVGVVRDWKEHKHPTTLQWSFERPTDNNYVIDQKQLMPHTYYVKTFKPRMRSHSVTKGGKLTKEVSLLEADIMRL